MFLSWLNYIKDFLILKERMLEVCNPNIWLFFCFEYNYIHGAVFGFDREIKYWTAGRRDALSLKTINAKNFKNAVASLFSVKAFA